MMAAWNALYGQQISRISTLMMIREPFQARLRDFVGQAEQMHLFFQNELRDTRGTARAVMAQMELIQFYGRAFAEIVRLLSEETLPDFASASLFEEAVRGRTVFWEWQRSLTSLLSPVELYQMQAHWENLAQMVQTRA